MCIFTGPSPERKTAMARSATQGQPPRLGEGLVRARGHDIKMHRALGHAVADRAEPEALAVVINHDRSVGAHSRNW